MRSTSLDELARSTTGARQAQLVLLQLGDVEQAQDQLEQLVALVADGVDELALLVVELAGDALGSISE